MVKEVKEYNDRLSDTDKRIVDKLEKIISSNLSNYENKIWHRHPVWFLNGNPIVGYSKLKNFVALLFWSGQSFEEDKLKPEGKFKAAQIEYTDESQINEIDLKRWLKKSTEIQWDYKNIVKRRGELRKLL